MKIPAFAGVPVLEADVISGSREAVIETSFNTHALTGLMRSINLPFRIKLKPCTAD